MQSAYTMQNGGWLAELYFVVGTKCIHTYRPNVVVDFLTHLVRIRNVKVSNFGQETSYSIRDFSWFPSVPTGKSQDSTLN
jgi:hypothetical protein